MFYAFIFVFSFLFIYTPMEVMCPVGMFLYTTVYMLAKDAYFLTWNPKISEKQPFSAFPKNFPYFPSFQEKKASFWGGDKNYHPRVVHALH